VTADDILDRLDVIINRDDYTRTLGLAVLNECQKWIQNEGDWTFMETLDSSNTTVDGTQAYAVPTRFKREIDVYLTDSGGVVTYLTKWRSTVPDRSRGNITTEQKPMSYFYFAEQLYLVPIPDAATWTINQRAYCYLADLTDSGSSTNKLTEYHADLLICMAARDIFNIFEDYDAAKIWNEGSGDRKDMCFKAQWDAFLKKEGKKQGPVQATRTQIRIK